MDNTVVILPITSIQIDPELIVNRLLKYHQKKLIVVIYDDLLVEIEKKIRKKDVNLIKVSSNNVDCAIMAGIEGIKRFFPGIKYVLIADIDTDYQLHILSDFQARIESGSDLVLGVKRLKRKSFISNDQLLVKLIIFMINILLSKKLIGISSYMMLRYDLLKSLKLHPQGDGILLEIIIKCLALDSKVDQVWIKSSQRKQIKSMNIMQSMMKWGEMFSLLKYAGFRLEDRVLMKLLRK